MKNQKLLFTMIVITLFSFMSAFAFAGGNQVLKAGKIGDLRSLEPYRNADPNYIFIEQTFDQLLFNERAQGQLPEAAEKWELAPDSMSITLTLRPNMTTHDGSEVNAEMLKWDITAARWLAEAYLNLNKLSQAETMCEKVFRQNPAAKTSGELSRIYWEVLEKANKHATLEMILKDAIRSGGREVAAVAQIKRGDMANSKGKTKEALIDGYLRTAILFRDVKSVQPEALFKATKALKKIGKVTDAEKMRKRLLEGYPESRYAQQLRGSN